MDTQLYGAVIEDTIDKFTERSDRLGDTDRISVEDQRTPTDNTVLHLACLYGSINCVQEILRVHESLLWKINSRGETALHLASRNGHYQVVAALVLTAKANTDGSSIAVQKLGRSPDLELETALHSAVRYNHKDVVDLLLTEDPSHSYPQNSHKETPLYLATVRGYTDIVRIILEKSRSPTFDGPDGRTALLAALMNSGGDGTYYIIQMHLSLTNIIF